MGRPRSCECGTCSKCKRRDYMRKRYQEMSPDERKLLVERRDSERVRADDRKRSKTPVRRAHIAATSKRWRKEHPDRARAHSAVAYALRTGKLVRLPCEKCGGENVHAHHDDYSKPLDVRWLCPLHHGAERKG